MIAFGIQRYLFNGLARAFSQYLIHLFPGLYQLLRVYGNLRRLSACTAILIGPEGDFTPDEIAMLINSGFVPVTLGDNRLRTETAALVGADTFHIVGQLAGINS